MSEAVIQQTQAALARGELLIAYDLAQTALRQNGSSDRLAYLRSLALARMGDPEGALESLGALQGRDGDEDTSALRGRLLKDLADQASEADRARLFAEASAAYIGAFNRFGGYFSLINAATTARLAGQGSAAVELAQLAIASPDVERGRAYYPVATHLEALVLLERFDEALTLALGATGLPDADYGARASTARQLQLLFKAMRSPEIEAIVDRIRPPPIVFYAGHMFRADPVAEARITAAIESTLDQASSTIAYGGAAAGADLLFAEAVLNRDGELSIVLPFSIDDYVRQSVLPWGESWEPRFRKVLAAAAQVTFPAFSASPYVGDPLQFSYGTEFAMGLTCLRAEHLCTVPIHIAVSDGSSQRKVAGTLSGIDLWESAGRPVIPIGSGDIDRSKISAAPKPGGRIARESRSIIMTDYAGFSLLQETERPRFLDEVMGRVADVLNARRGDVLSRSTWGDALLAVVSEPAAAADLALTLQERLAEVDNAAMHLPAAAGMRVALHHGPLFRARDPVTGESSFFGNEITRAARIEPITPVGQVYATQPFAALLALHSPGSFLTRYAGVLPLHKNFGSIPMHRVSRPL